MSEQGKPAIIQSLEKKLGLTLNPGPTPDLLVRDDYALQYALDEKNQLIGLNLAGCKLQSLELGSECQHLQVLNVGQTALRSLQISAEMTVLRELRAYECKELEKVGLPDSLEQLHYLDLSECALTQFQFPQGLLALKTFYLQKNKLQNLNWETACPALEFVDLSQNQLSSLTLPNGLNNLRYLYLNDNQLNKLECAGPLPALRVLHLRNNQLEELPLPFVQGDQMETMYLHNNPLTSLPREIIATDERKSSLTEVRDFLLELNKANNVLINDRAKLIIVGNGRVGKTSIFKQLKGEPFDPDEKYTHGVKIGKLSKEELPDVDTASLQLNVWDFGGQEIFYATHQFFLSDEAIYILAWTNKKNVEQYRLQSGQPLDEKWRDEEYWLDNIRLHGPNSPILMVQTHSDCRQNKMNPNPQYQEKYGAEFYEFSAKKRFGLEELKESIQEKLSKAVPMFGKPFPKSYERVIEWFEQTTENFITIEKFVEVCQASDITPGTELTVLSYLLKSGVVVYCDRGSLKEVVFTNPNWLTKQVYDLINNQLEARDGKIDRDYLEKNFPDYSAKELDRFVELLKTFKLIFELEGEQEQYIAPQYLPLELDRNTKITFDRIKKHLGAKAAFVFRFPQFMPDNVMVNFLSTYGPYSDKIFWRKGIFFVKDEQECIVELDYDSRTLWVFAAEHEESLALQKEICNAFIDLSKNTRAEISLDGQVFASWQKLQEEYTLYLDNPGQQFFAVDGKTPLRIKDFLRFFDRGEFGRFNPKSTNPPATKHQTMPTIKSLVRESRLKEALKALEKVVPDYLQNDVILQQSRLNGLEREENSGTISKENADIQRARIRGAIMSIYDDAGIKEVEPEPVEETNEGSSGGAERDTGDGFGDQPIEIPAIEPFEGSLIVPKGADDKTKILFLSANPLGQQNLAVDREANRVKVESQGKALNVVTCPHIDRRSMIDMVAFEKPQIVHFSGHGSNGGLALIDVETNRTASVSNEDLVRMFGLFKKTGVKCVVLCSCWSFNQAKSISELGIPVVGMLRKIGDEEAIQFSRDLYYLLVSSNPLELIFDLAKEKVNKASREIPSLWYNGKRIA